MNSSKPKVSIIIPVYNGERYVEETIKSVLAQTYKDYEIIIVNDGSKDGSYGRIKPFLSRADIKYFEQENSGVAAARNTGIRNSSGELIAFLDQDDLWLPEKLDVQVGYLQSHPDVALVHARQSFINENSAPIENYTKDWVLNTEGMCMKELFSRNSIAASTVLLNKSCLDKVGMFNEKISMADDYELWLRISKDHKIGFIDRILLLYRLHKTMTSMDDFKMDIARLGALESIAGLYPEIYNKLGQSIVRIHISELQYQLGVDYIWKFQDYDKARQHFFAAFKYWPFSWPTVKNLLWCSLKEPQRKAMRWYWHKIKIMSGLRT